MGKKTKKFQKKERAMEIELLGKAIFRPFVGDEDLLQDEGKTREVQSGESITYRVLQIDWFFYLYKVANTVCSVFLIFGIQAFIIVNLVDFLKELTFNISLLFSLLFIFFFL